MTCSTSVSPRRLRCRVGRIALGSRSSCVGFAVRLGLCAALGAACTAAEPGDTPALAVACREDLEASARLLERSYSGYTDKVTRLGESSVAQALERARSRIASEPATDCRQILIDWLSAFEDRHVVLIELESERATRLAAEGAETAKAPAAPVSEGPDPRLPSFETIAEGAALLRVPSFALRYREPLEELVERHRAEFEQRRDLILDLRGNGGGGDATYAVLGELIYTQPVQVVGADILASPENIAGWERDLRGVPEDVRAEFEPLVVRMRERPGEFISMGDDEMLEREVREPSPTRVALLIDGGCASSCEQFLLEAKASRKVRFFGERSGGVLDYANLVVHSLPSGRELALPSSRSRRLPGAPIDGVGVVPDVSIDPAAFDGPERGAALQRVLSELRQSVAPAARTP
jgi:hypothetical protein